MSVNDLDLDKELKKAQLAAALVDVDLKKKELQSRPSFWKNALTNPLVLGALITAFVTLNTGIVSWITASEQRQLEIERIFSQQQLDRTRFEADLLIKAIQTGNPAQSATNIRFLIRAGLIRDFDGRLETFLGQSQRDLPQIPAVPTAPQ